MWHCFSRAAQRRSELTAFDAASSEQAIIRWKRKSVSLVCDAVCARSPSGAVLVRLYKQSPAPLVEFRLQARKLLRREGTAGWARMDGSCPRRTNDLLVLDRFSHRLSGVSRLEAGIQQAQTAALQVSYTKSGDKLKVLSVSNTGTGEAISAVFK